MITREVRQSKIPEPQRKKTSVLIVIAAVVVILVAWIGLENLAKYLLWSAGIIAIIVGAYFSYLRYKD